MNIGILSRGPKLYSTKRLVEAAKKRGHKAEVIDYLRCYVNITSHKPSVHYKDRELKEFDAVVPRIGASNTFFGTAILRQFEMMGVYPLNESGGHFAFTGQTPFSSNSRKKRHWVTCYGVCSFDQAY